MPARSFGRRPESVGRYRPAPPSDAEGVAESRVRSVILREAPPCNLLVRCTLAPTEGPCWQNRGAGFLQRRVPLAGGEKVLRSRASDCDTYNCARALPQDD